ncbi:uncharacterized protein [Diadema setosum]|uniref:uncharacterized protein n=1 Tax=Diadema setosum TaxID=31175 RepID=UPI003B3AF9CC
MNNVPVQKMKVKRYTVLLSLAALCLVALWTVYQQFSSHPTYNWGYNDVKRHRKIATGHIPDVPGSEGFDWPVVRRKYLPNYFLMWDRPQKTASVLSYRDGNMVFLHHNKAGGSSIRKCLREIGKESGLNVSSSVFSYRYAAQEFHYWKHAPRTRKHVGLYGGYAFGVCDVLNDGRPCSYFTMIRDPYDRAISAYLYCSKNTSKDQLCTALKASEVSVVDWALHHGSFFFRQLLMNPAVCNGSYDDTEYLRNLDGFPHKFSRDIIPCWFHHKVLLQRMFTEEERDRFLQHVIDNLENYFAVIGLLEHFDLSLSMLQHVYHVPFRDKCSDAHYNTGKFRRVQQKVEAERLVASLKQQLLADPRVNETLRADLLLYEKAKSIFARQVEVYSHLTGRDS